MPRTLYVRSVKGAGQLQEVSLIDISSLDKRLEKTEIIAACDVTNPLCGPEGAVYVYGAQKGVPPHMFETLDKAMEKYALCIKKQLKIDITEVPGSVAAGGLGGGLMAFTGARLMGGIDVIIEYCGFKNQIKDADLLITGEGRTDGQTVYGKVPVGLASAASEFDVPVVCLSGALGPGYEKVYEYPIDAVFSILNKPMVLEKAMKKETAGSLLNQQAYGIIRLIKKITKS